VFPRRNVLTVGFGFAAAANPNSGLTVCAATKNSIKISLTLKQEDEVPDGFFIGLPGHYMPSFFPTLLLDSGVFGSSVAREGQCLIKAIEKIRASRRTG
jgi:hypothetical protein